VKEIGKPSDAEVMRSDVILVKAQAKSGGVTSMVIGGSGVLLGVMLLSWFPDWLRLMGIFVLSAGIAALLLGWFKLREPEYSMALTRTEIRYQHRYGQWALDWNNISRIDVPKVYRHLAHQPLTMVGIRIVDYDAFLSAISPRLMSNILTEQRPLLLQGLKQQLQEGKKNISEYSDYILEDTEFTSDKGQKYTGLQAMFAHRMQRMRESMGYDLYIATAELDRSADDFVRLLRECQASVREAAVHQQAD